MVHVRAWASSRRGAEREHGFTLVELLVVVIIIGILAGIAIPVFLIQRQRAQDAAVESDLRNMAGALTAFGTRDGGNMASAVAPADNVAGTAVAVSGVAQPTLDSDIEYRGSRGVDVYLGEPLTLTLCLVGHFSTVVEPWFTYSSSGGSGLILSRHATQADAELAC